MGKSRPTGSTLAAVLPALPSSVRGAHAFVRRAAPWLQGFERPIGKVVALALVLASITAAAPLAVMHLIDVLGYVTAARAGASIKLAPASGPAIFWALVLLAAAELAQVGLGRLLEAPGPP